MYELTNFLELRPTLLTGEYVRVETYPHQRPTDRVGGEEIDGVGGVPYDRWNDGPPEMQLALYQAVCEIVTGRRAPPEWDGAVVKMLPKRADEEHILESNRSICLIATAVKLVTGIWAHRLSKAAEGLGHFESTQEGNRPVRSGPSDGKQPDCF